MLIPGVGAVTRQGVIPFSVVPAASLGVGPLGRCYPSGAGALAINLAGAYGPPVSLLSMASGDFTGTATDISFSGTSDNHVYFGYSSSSGGVLRARGSGIEDVHAGMADGSTRGKWTVYGATFSSSVSRSLYVDGVLRNTGTGSVVCSGLSWAALGDYWRGSWGNQTGAPTVVGAIWARALADSEHAILGRSTSAPWEHLLSPIERRIWVPSASSAVPSITAVYADSVTASSVVPRVTLDFA